MKRIEFQEVFFMLLSFAVLFLSCGGKNAEGMLIENIRVISGIGDSTGLPKFVWIKDGRIFSLTDQRPAARFQQDSVLDGSGKFLIPGLIDAHVHLYAIQGMTGRIANAHPALRDSFRSQLPRSYLYYGFTTLADLGERYGLDRFLKSPIRPDILHCDFPLTQANGYGMTFDTGPDRYDDHPNFLWDDLQQADIPDKFRKEEHTPSATVGRVFMNGGRAVKVKYEDGFGGVFNWPNPSEQTIREVVRESHRKGLPVILHANSVKAYEFGLKTGVDVLAHGLWHWGEHDNETELPERVRKVLDSVVMMRIGVMPTMRVTAGEKDVLGGKFLEDPYLKNTVPSSLLEWYGTEAGKWYVTELNQLYVSNENLIKRKFGYSNAYASRMSVINAYISQHRRSINYLAKKDAVFLFGSDTPSSPSYTNPPGYNGYLEMQELINCGLSLRQLFEALTINNARAFGIADEYGTVEEGKRANLLVLKENPLVSGSAYNSIEKVILNGAIYNRNLFKAH